MEVQNTDGGLGLSGDYTSDILDSVLALESINASSSAEVSSEKWRLLCYIARQMNSDGSFSYTKNSDSDVALDEPNRNAFVSEDFYRMVKDNNLKGFKFEPIENISSLNKKYQYELSYFNYNEKIDSRDYKEIINNYKYAIEAFDISESDNFGAIEKIHTIVNESDYSSVIPDKYDDITEVSIGLGVLFGQFICDSYGWKWRIVGMDKNNNSFSVVSPNEEFCLFPLGYMKKTIESSLDKSNEYYDNTILLLYNMLERIEEKKTTNNKLCPLA